MSLAYFGQAPADSVKVAALQLLGRLAVPPLMEGPRSLLVIGIDPAHDDGPLIPLLPNQAPHWSLFPLWMNNAQDPPTQPES